MTGKAKRRARRSAKGGRPRVEGVEREASGRISRRIAGRRREMSEEEAKSVGIEARMRHTGLPRELVDLNHAGRPNAGTPHGVLYLQGRIDLDQWSAAEWYLGRLAAFHRAIQAPGRVVEASDGIGPMAVSDDPEEDYAEWVEVTLARWRQILDVVQDAATVRRSPCQSALDHVLCRGQLLDHMLGDLRFALDAIHREFPEARPVGH